MKSDGRDHPPNLVQIDTKKHARQGGSIMYLKEEQSSVRPVVLDAHNFG